MRSYVIPIMLALEEERMQNHDCQQWITEALESMPWESSPILTAMRQHYGEAFQQRIRDFILLPLLGYRSIREAEEDLPYGRDGLYEWMKLKGFDWFEMVEEITFALFFHWLEYGQQHDPSTLSRNRIRMIFDHTLIVTVHVVSFAASSSASFLVFRVVGKQRRCGEALTLGADGRDEKLQRVPAL